MSFSPETIDRIVANVLSQLSAPGAVTAKPVPRKPQTPASAPLSAVPFVTSSIAVDGAVVTAEALESISVGATVEVAPRAIVTPAAQDVVKGRKLQLVRRKQSAAPTPEAAVSPAVSSPSLLIVVKNSKPLDQLWAELNGTWRRELVGCPDDAAKLAMGELCRGGATQVVIVAEQTHRAACLANRNEKAKAVAIRDAGDVRLIRKQLRANVWCLDGAAKTYFELKNIVREIQAK